MDLNFTRRKFLGGAAAAGAAALIPSSAMAGQRAAHTAATGAAEDTANRLLTGSTVEKVAWKAKPFSMTEVRLLPSFWKDTAELNRSWLYSLPNERLAYNFRVTAGIPTDADPLGGWEAPDCELRGHYVGHFLSACALMYARTGDEALKDKAGKVVAGLAECQAKLGSGYLSAYPETF